MRKGFRTVHILLKSNHLKCNFWLHRFQVETCWMQMIRGSCSKNPTCKQAVEQVVLHPLRGRGASLFLCFMPLSSFRVFFTTAVRV